MLAVLAAVIMPLSCYKDGSDYVSEDCRISLFPAPVTFAADGTTVSGSESYAASVVVNKGSSVDKSGWTADVLETPSWVHCSVVDITTSYDDTWGTGIHDYSEKGVEIILEPNTGAARQFTLRISVPSSGQTKDFVFKQEAGNN